ncbi:B9 domain-containing protein 2 isoform X2 [Cuculus canorus]|uniref:B9 domain-containing protein 2 isoform X2 n=1 Tax=Cuculus canorus TaxID=55661 RepID=UPI0023AA7ABD|nr:B9 domain-containing protein 2 isoform X2 [Cuculus canorus]
MAEVHIMGQIVGGSGFPQSRLFCKWEVQAGGAWKLLEGAAAGQTHVDAPQAGDVTYWCHPLDVHFATKGLQGWPKLLLEVWHQDDLGRTEVLGYGFCHLPSGSGCHALSCVTWRPRGTWWERLRQRWLGGGPQLRSPETITTGGSDRFQLRTETAGVVHLELGVLSRHLDSFGVQC